MKQILLTISFFILINSLNAQSDTTNEDRTDKANSFYTDYSDKFIVKSYLLFKLNTLEIKKEDLRISLSPNSPTALGFALNYKFAGAAIGIGLPHSKQSIEKYGKTERLDIQMSIFQKNIGLDAHFQIYKG